MKLNLKNKFCKIVLFIFFSFNIFSQNKDFSALEYFNAAKTELENENYFSAYQYLLETLNKNPDFQDAYFLLAECSYQLNEFDLTLDYLEKAEKYFPNDSKILNLRGMTYISLGKINDAEQIFSDVLSRFPNDVTARFGKAELFLLNGKYLAAENEYNQALFRESSNRKALLSLALLSGQLGKYEKAQNYIQKALSFYTTDANVYYYSAVLSVMQKKFDAAEKSVRLALELNPNDDKFYELLANILYNLKKYSNVINICDFRISHDRNKNTAWFLKGFSQLQLGEKENALSTWTKGLEIFETDEIMRTALENLVNKEISIEDDRRKSWALYHIQTAREYDRKFDVTGAIFEYQRALKIDPFNVEARKSFANTLKLNGFNESYLEQLKFIKENSEQNLSDEINDTIEAYDSLLDKTLAKKWKTEQFYLDKTRYKIGIFYTDSDSYAPHVENNLIASEYAKDILRGTNQSSVSLESVKISSFGEAYRLSRKNNYDFFIILNLDEGFRDVTLNAQFYIGRTGTKVNDFSFYNTGNNRYSTAFRRLKNTIFSLLPVRGKILNRDGNTVLVDLGKTDNIVPNSVFDVVKKSAVNVSSSSVSLTYKDYDKLGTVKISNVGEEISEGILEYSGLYDKTNISDEIILISKPKENENQPSVLQNAPIASNNAADNAKKIIDFENLNLKSSPSFIDLIRGI